MVDFKKPFPIPDQSVIAATREESMSRFQMALDRHNQDFAGLIHYPHTYPHNTDSVGTYMRKEFEDAWDTIEALHAETRWIPVKEGLPEVGQTVEVALQGYVDFGHVNTSGLTWYIHLQDSCMSIESVTHWRPLPKGPQ